MIAAGFAAQILSPPGLESNLLSKLQPLKSCKMPSGIKHIFTGPGDWVPPPQSPGEKQSCVLPGDQTGCLTVLPGVLPADNPAFKPETKVDGACSAGFSFVNDVAVGHPES